MKVFVVAIVIFVIIMYLVYMLSLPEDDSLDALGGVFFYLAIFEWLCAAILLISIFLYVKRITMHNQIYGRAVMIEAIVFAISNTVAGFFNYYLSKNELGVLLEDRDINHKQPVYASAIIPYFIITEFMPAISFGYTMQVLSRVLSGELNEQNDQRDIERN